MATKTLPDLSEHMRAIDIAMLFTHSEGGTMAGRPMSNNGEVDYDGNSYYFTYEKFRSVSEIQQNPKVSLSFSGGDKSFYVAVEGDATLIRDKAAFKEHWTKDLDRWFKDGVDTEGMVLIKVTASRVHYWQGEEDGEVKL